MNHPDIQNHCLSRQLVRRQEMWHVSGLKVMMMRRRMMKIKMMIMIMIVIRIIM